MQIIDGKKLAEKIKDDIVKEIVKLGQRPNLAIILIGQREDSALYVSLKERGAKKVGIDTHLYKCPENIFEKEILEMIECLNNDETIDAILIQLPLPENFNTDKIIKAIAPGKDVDGFHPENLKKLLASCDSLALMPPVFGVVLEILKSINCDLENKKVCIAANSDIFGKSLAKVLECSGAKVQTTRGDGEDLKEKTSQADILITALGKPEFIKKDFIKKDAVVIDVGITKTKNGVKGDVDFEDVKNAVGHITPVPGGVGPMTIAMAFRNTMELFKKSKKVEIQKN